MFAFMALMAFTLATTQPAELNDRPTIEIATRFIAEDGRVICDASWSTIEGCPDNLYPEAVIRLEGAAIPAEKLSAYQKLERQFIGEAIDQHYRSQKVSVPQCIANYHVWRPQADEYSGFNCLTDSGLTRLSKARDELLGIGEDTHWRFRPLWYLRTRFVNTYIRTPIPNKFPPDVEADVKRELRPLQDAFIDECIRQQLEPDKENSAAFDLTDIVDEARDTIGIGQPRKESEFWRCPLRD